MEKKFILMRWIVCVLVLVVGLQYAFSAQADSQKLQEKKKSDLSYNSRKTSDEKARSRKKEEKSKKKKTKENKKANGTKKANDPAPRAKTPTGGAKTTDSPSKVKGDKKDVKRTEKAGDPAPRALLLPAVNKGTQGGPKDEVSGIVLEEKEGEPAKKKTKNKDEVKETKKTGDPAPRAKTK